jgi:DNA invertase Pin-like site-specific DNA recombinase
MTNLQAAAQACVTASFRQTVKIFIYVRLSEDKTGEGLAVDRQERLCRGDADRCGEKVVAVFNDNNKSATDPYVVRDDFEAMLTDPRLRANGGDVNIIRCYDADRLYRGIMKPNAPPNTPLDLIRLIQRKVWIRTHTGIDFDLDTDAGVLIAIQLAGVSGWEGSHKARRQTDAYREKAEGKGRTDGRARPSWKYAMGYIPETRIGRDDNGTRRKDPKTAPLVGQAYRLIAAGGKITDVVTLWNDAGARTIFAGRIGKEGSKNEGKMFSGLWDHRSVRKTLQDPRNAGFRDYTTKIDVAGGKRKLVTTIMRHDDGTPVRGTWPPLVDEDLWYTVQDVLDQPERLKAGNRSVGQYLLTGVLKCGKCDAPLNGNRCGEQGRSYTRRNGTSAVYPTVFNYSCHGCRGLAIGRQYTEPVVIATVAGRLAMDDAQDLLKAEVQDEAKAEEWRIEEVKLYESIAKAEAEHRDNIIEGPDLKRRRDAARSELKKIDRLRQDQRKREVFKDLPLGKPEVVTQILHMAATPTLQNRFRTVVNELCTVKVMPIGRGQHTREQIRERTVVEFTDGTPAADAYARYVKVTATLQANGQLHEEVPTFGIIDGKRIK